HYSHNLHLLAIVNGIYLSFFGAVKEMVYKDIVIGEEFQDFYYGVRQLIIIYYNSHALAAQYIRRTYQYRVTYQVCGLERLFGILCRSIRWVWNVKALQHIAETLAV